MANKTTNYGLTKPLSDEFYDVEVQNGNMDIIDTQMKALDSKSATAKTTLVDADTIPLNDSAASNALKKITWANVKAVLANVFAAKTHNHTKSEISDFPSSMTPSSHASTHKTGGSDAISPSDIGAVPTSRTVNGKALSSDVSLTASDVGLGNVPNVTTNNQTPTYTQASSLSNIASGEKLSTSMGKIMKAIADLISHLSNKSNPHGVTASQVGAVPENQDIIIQKDGVTYDSIFGQGTHNALLRVRNTAGNSNNQRTLALFDSTQRPDIETALRLYDVVDGTETLYSIFGEHNLDKLATALGTAKIATGSYVGTDTFGASNLNTLTFDFAPKLVIFTVKRATTSNSTTYPNEYSYITLTDDYDSPIIDMSALTSDAYAYNYAPRMDSNNKSYAKKSADGKTLYWYNNNSAARQCNSAGSEYFYVAIG